MTAGPGAGAESAPAPDPVSESGLLPAYREWLERLTATYEAVAYTCRVRMGDAAAGEAVALRVASGLLARPAVFRHWGLPYSGRIAKLAEDAILAVERGEDTAGTWSALYAALAAVPDELQQVLVLTCVEGRGDDEVAVLLGCDAVTASRRRAATLAHVASLAPAPA